MNHSSLASQIRDFAAGRFTTPVYVPKNLVAEWADEFCAMGLCGTEQVLRNRLKGSPGFDSIKVHSETLRRWAQIAEWFGKRPCGESGHFRCWVCSHQDAGYSRDLKSENVQLRNMNRKLMQENGRLQKAMAALANDLSTINGCVGNAQRIVANVD